MRTLALILAAAAAFTLIPAAPASADPLLCLDPGAVDIGPYTVDPPPVCVL